MTLQNQQGKFPAIGFIMQQDNERYIGGLSVEETAKMIATAKGPLGACADYLENTVKALDEIDIADGPLHKILIAMQRYQQEG